MEKKTMSIKKGVNMNAVMPYERDDKCKNHKTVTTKVYINITEDKECKVVLNVYGGSEEEDCERFFEMFERFQKEMKKFGKWDDNATQSTDASVLFDAFDECLSGTAQTDWYEILEGPVSNSQTWKDFKNNVTKYIMRKVLPPNNPYQTQRNYMEQRVMPEGMPFTVWWKRVQTLSQYLQYMMDRDLMEEISAGKEKELKKLWHYGAFNAFELKNILINKVPRQWYEEFDSSALSYNSNINEICRLL